MDDAGDAVVVEDRLARAEVGDVARDPRHAVRRCAPEDERQAPPLDVTVEGDDGNALRDELRSDPSADAAGRAGDEGRAHARQPIPGPGNSRATASGCTAASPIHPGRTARDEPLDLRACRHRRVTWSGHRERTVRDAEGECAFDIRVLEQAADETGGEGVAAADAVVDLEAVET